jgi:hypothetical protein
MNDNQDSFSGLPLPENMGSSTPWGGAFTRISIPLIKRVYPQLIASKITSIQPLLSPSAHKSMTTARWVKKWKDVNESHLDDRWIVKFPNKIWRRLDEPWESSQIELF